MRATVLLSCVFAGGFCATGGATRLLDELSRKSYVQLARMASFDVSPEAVEAFRKTLESRKKTDQASLEDQAKALSEQEEAARRQLERLNREASRDTQAMSVERRELHCRILKLEQAIRNNNVERRFGLGAAYGNEFAKLALIEKWPAERNEIHRAITAGRARERPHGDVEDIGVRKVGDGQERDIQLGMDGLRELRGAGLLPPELEDEEVRKYVQSLADRIAANSDLRVPAKVAVLASNEINSFSLPGGFIFVNAGLIETAEREFELAGVLGHEIAHVAARHGNRLTRGLSIRNIVSQGAQMAANVFTGGAAGTARQYARQYGFLGFGVALNLRLLGVNPQFEAEADRLGIQYLWRAGYDPSGFIVFFDKMASEPSSLRAASFFHVHPPDPEAIQTAFSELEYLPARTGLTVDSARFHAVKEMLRKAMQSSSYELEAPAGPGPIPECEDGGVSDAAPMSGMR